jgi:UDP-N-acetylglucosamine--dolichyl-phosphate N-acetylglucosaminephosphotransferase
MRITSNKERIALMIFFMLYAGVGATLVVLSLLERLTVTALYLFFIGVLAVSFTFYVTRKLIPLLKLAAIIGRDVHKPLTYPPVPERGGIAIFFGFILSTPFAMWLFPQYFLELFVLMTIVLNGAVLGFLDDSVNIPAKIKPLLFLIPAFPIYLAETYSGHPLLPIIGGTRLTLVYLILIPIIMTVCANTVNQVDTLNGVMPATTIIILIGVLIASVLRENLLGAVLTLPLLGVLLGYLPFNKYPAKIFSGNVGSFTVGTALGGIAIIGGQGLEVMVLTALLPHIFNSLSIFSTVRGFKEKKEMVRPVLVKNEIIIDSRNPVAPLTLTRLLTARTPKTEPQLIYRMILLVIISTLLGLIGMLVIP